jgi:prepilin-type N-terminal cleavage/methylation domain-containing protein
MSWAAFDSTRSFALSRVEVSMRSGGRSADRRDDGFTILEVLIAMLLLAIMALGVAQLFAVAIQTTTGARHQTTTTILAAQKMEQLRALTWGFDSAGTGLPVTDSTTDLAQEPAAATGNGLNPSPANSLETSTPGYVDYLDQRGQWVGTGAAPTPNAVFIRRWNITPLPTNPNNTLILQVLVTTVRREAAVAGLPGPRRRYGDDALIVTVKTRKSK